jgi:uncharacterized protein (TIGR00369 family)
MNSPTPATASASPHDLAAARKNAFPTVPFTRLLGVRAEDCEDGRSRLVVDVREDLENLGQMAHGGVILTLLDVAMARAALSKVDFAQAVVTIDLSSSFVQPGRGRLTATGRVSGGGKSICFCEAQVHNEAGQLVARSMGSFKYVPLQASSAAVVTAEAPVA